MPKYLISDLILEIDAPDWVIHKNLESFSCNTEKTDVYCSIVFSKHPALPSDGVKQTIKAKGTSIFESNNQIYQYNGDINDIPSCLVAEKDWSRSIMYVNPDYYENEEMSECVRIGILASLRDIMTAVLSNNKGLLIHSCSIIWNNMGILFSAPSGTGKSTHAHLWKQLYQVPVLDGDVTACRMVNNSPVVYGLPWCGTSGEFLNTRVSLGAIVFLEQAKENSIIKLDFYEAFIRLTARCFMLPWNEKMATSFLDNAELVAYHSNCYLLNCLPENSAVELVKTCLERI